MSFTKVTGNNILDKSIARADVNIATTGLALITKIILGTGLTMTSTGVDAGTGDVTLTSATAGVASAVTSVFGRVGAVIKATGDYNFADLSGLLTGSQFQSFTGDATSSLFVTSLAAVNTNIGTFNSFAVNAKGLVTSASFYQSTTTQVFATPLSGYADASSYYGLATAANGWPNFGSVTGQRYALNGNQRFVNGAGPGQFSRYWDNTNLVWKALTRTIESADYTAKGVVLFGSGIGVVTSLTPGADGLALIASAAASPGVVWGAVNIANGGSGATTAAAALIAFSAAAINSPAFTGSPTCPNPPAGDISQSFANTGFIQQAINGLYTLALPATGNVTLTPAQYLVPVIILTGAITAAVTVSFPLTGVWSVLNNSTGAFTVTLKTVAGTGITIGQGLTRAIVADNTNIQPATTDFTGLTNVYYNGAVGQILCNQNGNMSSSTVESSAQGNMVFVDQGDPVIPVRGATYYSKRQGGKTLFYQEDIDPTYANVWSFQASMSNTRANYWSHNGNSTLLTAPTVTSFGLNMLTAGTVVARNVVSGSYIGQNKRIGLVSATATNSSAEFYNNIGQWFVGSVNQTFKIGGFYFASRCIINDPVALTGGNTFIGFTALAGPIGIISTMQNLCSTSELIGLMCDTTDSNYKVGASSGTTLVTSVLSTPAPCTGAAFNGQTLCDVRFYSPSGLPIIYYYVKLDNYSSGSINNVYVGQFSTSIATTTLLTPRIFRGNGNNAAAAGVDIISLYIETLY